jgi:hypothetical protein
VRAKNEGNYAEADLWEKKFQLMTTKPHGREHEGQIAAEIARIDYQLHALGATFPREPEPSTGMHPLAILAVFVILGSTIVFKGHHESTPSHAYAGGSVSVPGVEDLPPDDKTAMTGEYAIVNTTMLNLRSCPSPQCTVVARATRGIRLDIVDAGEHGWFKVQTSGASGVISRGFVNGKYLTFSRPY